MNEIWKVIEEYPDYQVSNIGRIKSFKKNNENILNLNKNDKGYFRINLWKNKKYKTKKIHILVYETFYNDKLKSNECVHHKDENKENNYYENLEKMTKFNHKSFHNKNEKNPMFGKSLSNDHKNKIREKSIGVLSSNHKLRNEEVWLIKKILDSDYYKSGKITQEFIGEMFGVGISTVSDIKTGRTWTHLKYIIN